MVASTNGKEEVSKWKARYIGMHTPEDGEYVSVYEIETTSGERICTVTHPHHELIAAAPDLLAHLEFAVKLLSAFPAMSGTAQVERMRDIISQARGESVQVNSKETK